MDSQTTNSPGDLLAGRPPATMAGGRRISHPTHIPNLGGNKNEEEAAKDARAGHDEEEGDSDQLIKEEHAPFMEQKLQHEHEMKNQRNFTNSQLNQKPNLPRQGKIRQPARFNSGLPMETKMVMKDIKGGS